MGCDFRCVRGMGSYIPCGIGTTVMTCATTRINLHEHRLFHRVRRSSCPQTCSFVPRSVRHHA